MSSTRKERIDELVLSVLRLTNPPSPDLITENMTAIGFAFVVAGRFIGLSQKQLREAMEVILEEVFREEQPKAGWN